MRQLEVSRILNIGAGVSIIHPIFPALLTPEKTSRVAY